MTHKGIHKKIMHHICNLFGYAVINEMIIHFKSYLSQMLMDLASIWVILKLTGVGPKSPANPNPRGSGSDQNPDRKAREPSPDRANNNPYWCGAILWCQKKTWSKVSWTKTALTQPLTPFIWTTEYQGNILFRFYSIERLCELLGKMCDSHNLCIFSRD